MRWATSLGLVVSALFAPSAMGATVSTHEFEYGGSTIIFTAAPGERNELRVEYAHDQVFLSDRSNPVTPLEGFCHAVDEHTVACPDQLGPVTLVLNTGDEADRVDLRSLPVPGAEGAPPTINPQVEAGPGGDVIYGSQLDDVLGGGSGHDTVDGAAGSDTLAEGSSPRNGESDFLNGGDGLDRVSYEGRSVPVAVNVAADVAQGARGEGDRISGIEGAVGGRNADLLALGPGGGTLDGGPGADRLMGSRAADLLLTGDGSDIVWAGGGGDSIEMTGPHEDKPRISCGRGDDHVWQVFRHRRRGPLAQLGRGCEHLEARWFEIQQYDTYVIEGGRLGLLGTWTARDEFELEHDASTRSGFALGSCCFRSVKLFDPSERPVKRDLLGSSCELSQSRVLVRLNAAGQRRVRPGKTSRVLLRVTYSYPGGSPYDGKEKYVSAVRAWIDLPKNNRRGRANECSDR